MKIKIFALTSVYLISTNLFGTELPSSLQDSLCQNAGAVFGPIYAHNTIGVAGAFENVISTSSGKYTESGNTFKVEANQNHQLFWKSGDFYPTYETTRKFSYFSGNFFPTMHTNLTASEDYHIDISRGSNYITVIATDKEVRQQVWDGTKWVDDYFVPLCEAIQVWGHNKPVVSSGSVSGGSSILASISITLDNYSKTKREGNGEPVVIWKFKNTFYNQTESITTNSSSISFAPQYNGEYAVSVSVSDGTLSTLYTVGYIMFNGGINCTTCGNIN